MFRLIKFLFGPRLGRVRMHGTSVTLYNIETGVLQVIEPDYGWAGNVKEWSDDGCRLIGSASEKKTRRPIERFTISYENEGLKKMGIQPKPFLWENQMLRNERELNDCGTVTA